MRRERTFNESCKVPNDGIINLNVSSLKADRFYAKISVFWRLVSINNSGKRTVRHRAKTEHIRRSDSSNPRSVFPRHRVVVYFFPLFLSSFFLFLFFFTDQARRFCARQRIFQRTNVDGRVAAQCRPHVIRVCCTRRVFARRARAFCPSNFTGFPARYYFCSRVSIRFTKGTVYAAV